MAGVNKVILLGRLGRDPEVRYTQDGTAVANFSVATSDEWRDRGSGEKKERTEWHRVVAWRRLGEICGEYLFKGRQVFVEGRLSTRSWEQDGKTRYMTEIIATDVQFVGSKEVAVDQESMPEKGIEVDESKYSNLSYQESQEDDVPF